MQQEPDNTLKQAFMEKNIKSTYYLIGRIREYSHDLGYYKYEGITGICRKINRLISAFLNVDVSTPKTIINEGERLAITYKEFESFFRAHDTQNTKLTFTSAAISAVSSDTLYQRGLNVII
jgi:hypothetical protein